jgi:hypothetical protein
MRWFWGMPPLLRPQSVDVPKSGPSSSVKFLPASVDRKTWHVLASRSAEATKMRLPSRGSTAAAGPSNVRATDWLLDTRLSPAASWPVAGPPDTTAASRAATTTRRSCTKRLP